MNGPACDRVMFLHLMTTELISILEVTRATAVDGKDRDKGQRLFRKTVADIYSGSAPESQLCKHIKFVLIKTSTKDTVWKIKAAIRLIKLYFE